MFFNEPKTLIVIYKDEMLANQIKKLVETKDDENDGSVVGTKDGTVKIVAWSEKVWLDQKKAGTIDSKILFLGDIKDTDKLIPIIDVKFDDCGVKYGWAGNQAIVWCNPKQAFDENTYKNFIDKLSVLPIPEKLRKDVRNFNSVENEKESSQNKVVGIISKIGENISSTAKDVLVNKQHIRKQMLFYGVISLYNNDLEDFILS